MEPHNNSSSKLGFILLLTLLTCVAAQNKPAVTLVSGATPLGSSAPKILGYPKMEPGKVAILSLKDTA